ncbi:MAG: NHL repeat-containing protein, partial [Anaerolineae bacterium]|nr:NHL repeat-containing protein [Anaerolineae bacterium]
AGLRALTPLSIATLPGAGPRDVVSLPDGTLYVADTAGHRIWHITSQGDGLALWGEYGTGPGQFNEPWGIALDKEGYVYVADTWNHRIQKFDANGQYLHSWGTLAQVSAYDPAGQGVFFGPRGIAVGLDGNIYVTDTGNKRVQVFDTSGIFLWEFGGSGAGPGQMNEPVGIEIDSVTGEIFVADTWNRRVQVFTADGVFARQWSISTWAGGNPEEKPFLTLDGKGNVYVDDPVRQRILVFDTEGHFQWAIDGKSPDLGLAFPEGLAVVDGVLYIGDAHTSRILGVELP